MGTGRTLKTLAGRRLATVILLQFLAFPVTNQSLCYSPDGQVLHDWGLCHSTQNGSLCCGIGDKCFSNKLCQATDTTFYRGGCTDVAFFSHPVLCPLFCTSGMVLKASIFPMIL